MTHEAVRAIARAEIEKTIPLVFTVTTEDATPLVAAAIDIDSYSTGILRVEVVAMDDVGTGGVTCIKKVRWMKTGSLTLSTVIDDMALETDLVGADVNINAASDNIEIEVTGTASDVINWRIEIKSSVIKATTSP